MMHILSKEFTYFTELTIMLLFTVNLQTEKYYIFDIYVDNYYSFQKLLTTIICVL